ncbi:MAG TPA: twin-arginine translocation pathway signal protein [Planctomycetes bacterium]|nr:twin-arginine translocation pathway signal protein [Planctomycetota bacterium]
MRYKRRDFLKLSGAGLALAPGVLLNASEKFQEAEGEHRLVVLQLTGGNDGLNTVVPFEDDRYHRSRPALAIPKARALRLEGSSELGLHPSMEGLQALYKEGHLAVIQGVGYPGPDRSHFRSMDIWHTANPSTREKEKGWLGKALEKKPSALSGIHIGDEALPLAFNGERHVASIQNLDFIELLSGSRGAKLKKIMRAVNEQPRAGRPGYVRGLANETLDSLDKILSVSRNPPPVEYPDSELGRRLKLAGQMVAGGYPARILYLSQGGYDTHARQGDAHTSLLGDLSGALTAFYRHVEKTGAAERVTVMVFSEFGRRVKENASLGTDHGCAAPLFLLSGKIKGGLHGPSPDLSNLDRGDLRFTIDFRRVYATLAEELFRIDSKKLLGGSFDRLGLFT